MHANPRQYEYIGQTIAAVPFIEEHALFLNYNDTFMKSLQNAHVDCGYAAYLEQYYVFPASGVQPPLDGMYNTSSDSCDVWTLGYYAAYQPNPCFNVYAVSCLSFSRIRRQTLISAHQINNMCPIQSDPLGYPTDLQFQYEGMGGVYFNRSDVKAAIHGKSKHSTLIVFFF